MLKQFIFILILGLTFNLIGLAQENELEEWQCPEGFANQSLEIYGWVDYVSAAIEENFEASCNVELSFTGYDDEWSMYDAMKLGNPGYDLLIASGTLVEILAADNLAVPLEHSLIPNQTHIAESFLEPSYDPENLYSLPYVWGAVGVAYRHELFPEGIDSWQQVWDYEGNVLWLNDQRAMLGIGLLNLGYDPNSDNAAEISAARDFLGEHGANVGGIYGSSDTFQYLAEADTDIMIVYTYLLAAYWAECACEDYGLTIPDEGSNIFVDNMMIPVDADSPELAMVFMDYVLHPQVNAEITNAIPSSTNASAVELGLVEERYLNETGFNPGIGILANSFFIEPLEEDVATFYDVAWSDLLLFYGELP